MRTISEMYKLSGGTDYRNLCAECSNCVREGKSFICRLYVEARGNRRWEPQWIACKFFNIPHLPGKRAAIKDAERQQEGIQMSIFDYPECIPEESRKEPKEMTLADIERERPIKIVSAEYGEV